MAAPVTREEFAAYCLRALGDPVVQINVSDDQIEDRIDEALKRYQDFHMDATERVFVTHLITEDDQTNRYITLDPSILSVVKVFSPFEPRASADLLFDPQSQFNASMMMGFINGGIVPYVIGRQHQALVTETFRGKPLTRFTRHKNRLYIDVDWDNNFPAGYYVIADCYQLIDPDDYENIWSDQWLQRYATALLKRQWGQNLSKYTGIALPGNVTLDGKSMYMEAMAEIAALDVELDLKYQLPPEFFVG